MAGTVDDVLCYVPELRCSTIAVRVRAPLGLRCRECDGDAHQNCTAICPELTMSRL